MGFRKHFEKIESMIMSNRIVFLNWTADTCSPCKDQQKILHGIRKDIDSEKISVFDVDFTKYKKNFKRLGNVVVPSLNVFVDGMPISFVDTKLNPMKKTGFWKHEKVVNKNVTADRKSVV